MLKKQDEISRSPRKIRRMYIGDIYGMNNDDLNADDPNIIEGEVTRSYSPPQLPEQKLLPAPEEDDE